MHLILTHEHADFDAFASLLAAALLHPQAFPILPHHLNRNVQNFYTLYRNRLPFLDRGHRPHGKVEQITMVDSQHLPQVRGRTEHTRFHIIDHHPRQHDGSDTVSLTLVDTGATATYLVEQLAQQAITLSPLHATLLLLGIHEDTGSLTFTSTTIRDMRAATWLLEQGARLDILREFLAHPLSESQAALYATLTQVMQTLSIHGHSIMLAVHQTEQHVDEISSVAHRLRELYQPDALFLLVGFSDYCQLVARSTTDDIHVGHIAAHFGGGGHPRAAAAHIDTHNLEEIQEQLRNLLETEVRPAATVAQIMSQGVRVLHPNQPIRDAAELMMRHGHEGYPVVDEGRIVGILTRREVDKAMHHQLGQARLGEYMHAGEIFVTPQDTIETVQRIMFRERIGQVPVVDQEQIIGVVTRTDLIRYHNQEDEQIPQNLNLSQALQEAIESRLLQLLVETGRIAAETGNQLFIVGGFVRDLLLGIFGHDIDLVVEGDAVALARAMQAKHGGRVRSHNRFRTATWLLDTPIDTVDRLDFVTARTEFYQHPTALPEIESSSIKQDFHRRDFTINTLAIRLNPQGFGDLLDFYGGYNDLQNKHLRVLHSLSFVEDPTRILRAIRLEQRLGFNIGPRTMTHLKNAIDLIDRLTHDRIYSELIYTLKEAQPERVMSRLSELGLLQVIDPELKAETWFRDHAPRLRQGDSPWANEPPQPEQYLALLLYPLDSSVTHRISRRLKIPAQTEKLLNQVQSLKTVVRNLESRLSNSQLYHQLHRFQNEALRVIWAAVDQPLVQQQLVHFCRTVRLIQPAITGHDLINEFKLKPSPRFAELLGALRDARLDGKVTSRAEEAALLKEWLAAAEEY